MHIIEGNYQSGEIRVGIVAPRFNEAVVSRLISGAEDGLVRHGVKDGQITLVRVPGAFEIPSAAKKWLFQDAMMQSYVWERLSAGRPAIMIMSVQRFLKELLLQLWKREFQFYSAF